MSYFPLFVDITGKKCLIVGGGRIALRRAVSLSEAGAILFVVAPGIEKEIFKLHDITCCQREYESSDIDGMFLVIAATDNPKLNEAICAECREKGILVNQVHRSRISDVVMPSFIRKGNLLAAFTSGGDSPFVTKYMKEQLKHTVTDELSEISEYLGTIRDIVKKYISKETRSKVYEEIFSLCMEKKRILTTEELQQYFIMKGVDIKWTELEDLEEVKH